MCLHSALHSRSNVSQSSTAALAQDSSKGMAPLFPYLGEELRGLRVQVTAVGLERVFCQLLLFTG